ncbi:hypothetical protein LPTSP2_38610 [Leptospira ellinghausenii]|uniref:Uncharacterized protein n=1 Tax=Leptospira ellinghausenii TaxID=1917822 RepID=A0A2P2DIU8_9LEPT|nr:hypothetical protein [Leptospira ellinghausenii]GBF44558.1 hypothetical protein LPTSP2_38610 [Leptospira ellinghausenii]
MKETHLIKVGNETHLFYLKEEGNLQSFCGLNAMPDYQFKNLKNIFHTEGELTYYITKTTTFVCDICRRKFNMLV